jgi:hypothetical protein
MDVRDILARNLGRLMERDSPPGAPLSVRAWAQGKALDERMIYRLVKGEHAVTLDKLDEIAAACGLQAWHLLLPDLDVGEPPSGPITPEDRAMLARLRRMLGDNPP